MSQLSVIEQENLVGGLKRQAAKYLKKYYAMLPDYDCGRFMAEYFQPSAVVYKNLFNETMDKLAQIDPDCPKERL